MSATDSLCKALADGEAIGLARKLGTRVCVADTGVVVAIDVVCSGTVVMGVESCSMYSEGDTVGVMPVPGDVKSVPVVGPSVGGTGVGSGGDTPSSAGFPRAPDCRDEKPTMPMSKQRAIRTAINLDFKRAP